MGQGLLGCIEGPQKKLDKKTSMVHYYDIVALSNHCTEKQLQKTTGSGALLRCPSTVEADSI